MKINTGLNEKNRQSVAEKLSVFLADTYLLYLKTQNFHWNITGPDFYPLHKMLEEQYEQLANATDELAERIRSLDFPAPASFTEFLKLTQLKEASKKLTAKEMISHLLADHETIIREGRKVIAHAQDVHDEASADLIIKRLDEHEKTAWMLRSILQ